MLKLQQSLLPGLTLAKLLNHSSSTGVPRSRELKRRELIVVWSPVIMQEAVLGRLEDWTLNLLSRFSTQQGGGYMRGTAVRMSLLSISRLSLVRTSLVPNVRELFCCGGKTLPEQDLHSWNSRSKMFWISKIMCRILKTPARESQY